MKIDSISRVMGQYSKVQAYEARKGVDTQYERDEVQLSESARTFTEAFSAVRRSMMAESPEKNVRMNEIMQKMQTGEYGVPCSDLCDKILS